MSNIAVILAAGLDQKFDSDIPVQFMNVYDKPVLIYTLESFQKHPQIDAIEIVCIDGWIEVVKAYARQFNIDKLKWVVRGGDTVQNSISTGLFNLENEIQKDDLVIIHDGIRPMINGEILSDVILVAKQYGNAISSLPYNEQIFRVDATDSSRTKQFIPRETVRRVSTPQAYCFERLDAIYHQAISDGRGMEKSTYADTLMADYGEKLHFAAGSDRNIKITAKESLQLFKAYLKMDKDAWLK